MNNNEKLKEIQKMYNDCLNINEYDKNSTDLKRKRGLLFEDIIYNLSEIHSLQPQKNISHPEEQIDITIRFDQSIYLIEIRWRKKLHTKDIRDFFGKLWKRKCKGIFIYHGDLSNVIIKETSEFSKDKTIILFDRTDIKYLIEEKINLKHIIREKERVLIQDNNPFIPISDILKKEEKTKIRSSENYAHLIDARDKRYLHINDLFVAPNQYDVLVQKLKENKLVFITGEPHIGKTYTALYILYSFYMKKGYLPKWYRFEQRSNWLDMLINDASQLLKPNQIIYFEDPVGKKDYEYSSFVAKLGSIISDIKNHNCLVIFTSRELPYTSLKYDTESIDNPDNYIFKMKETSPTYTKEKMKKILEKYTNLHNPKWRDNVTIYQKVLNGLNNPHNIEYFVKRTVNVTSEQELLKEITISKEIIKAFANEIGSMSIQESLFVLTNYLIGFSEFADPKKYYTEVMNRLPIPIQKIDHWRYCLKKFDGCIISRSYSNIIQYTHPSYEEAIEFSIRTNIDINLLFERIIEVTIRINNPKYDFMLTKVLMRNYSSLKNSRIISNYVLNPVDGEQIIESVTGIVNNFELFDVSDAIKILKTLLLNSRIHINSHIGERAGKILFRIYPSLDINLKLFVDESIKSIEQEPQYIHPKEYQKEPHVVELGYCEDCSNFTYNLRHSNCGYLCENCYELLH